MEMVAASKMRKAQEAALSGRPFVRLLYTIQREATTRMSDFSHPLLEVREVRKRAVILVGADKGLCGALNSNLFRLAAKFDPQSTVFITAGRKAAQFIATLKELRRVCDSRKRHNPFRVVSLKLHTCRVARAQPWANISERSQRQCFCQMLSALFS